MNQNFLFKDEKNLFPLIKEKRRQGRKSVCIEAKVICHGFSYAAFIGDISDRGLYMMTTPLGVMRGVTDGANHTVTFSTSPTQTISLRFREVWSGDVSPLGLTQRRGVEIIGPPSRFREFLLSL